MTNTYFGPGAHNAEQIIADTPKALYAKSLSGGQVNPATGEFVFGVAEGYLIENGRITTPVRGATLIGSGAEVLAEHRRHRRRPGHQSRQLRQGGAAGPGGHRPADHPHPRTDGGRHEPRMSAPRGNNERTSPLATAKRALDRGRRLGADLEVYCEAGKTASIKVYGGEVESISVAQPSGLGVRAVRGGRVGYAFTADLSDSGLDAVLAGAVANVDVTDADPYAGSAAERRCGLPGHPGALAAWAWAA